MFSPMETTDASLFPSPEITVTREELNSFHSVDRALFSRLVLVIGRDRTESVQVISLWLWLERHSGRGRHLIRRMLSFPDRVINMLVQETVKCLRILAEEPIMATDTVIGWRDENNVPMLHSILGGRINLSYFNENRVRILLGVKEITEEVCFRAFIDILLPQPRGRSENVRLGIDQELEDKTPRTLFLTFSKGYPTSDSEVREFFTRKYGRIVEAIHMQRVSPGAQSLYAKLVVRSVGVVDVILQGQRKVKFTINGKHVLVRKFVKKTTCQLI